MEVPPLKKLPKNEQTNNKIYEFDEKLRISHKETLKNQNTSCMQHAESDGKLQRSLLRRYTF